MKTREEIREHNIQVAMLKCRHFNGVQNKVCEAGVNYDDVVPIPCIGYRPGETVKQAECDKKSCWTREEAVKNEEEATKRTATFLLALHAASEAAKTLGLKKGRGGAGTTECPICKGVLHFSVAAYNGHLWGKCDTKGCAAWMGCVSEAGGGGR